MTDEKKSHFAPEDGVSRDKQKKEEGCDCECECEECGDKDEEKSATEVAQENINPEEVIKACLKERNEYLDNWKRERANLMNYKKEEGERVMEATRYRKEEMILKILPVLDSFLFAESHLSDEQKKDQYISGMLAIRGQLDNFLKSQGVEEIKNETDDFNPLTQEAVDIVETEGVESGKVVAIVKNGYKLGEKLIRPMQVRVSK